MFEKPSIHRAPTIGSNSIPRCELIGNNTVRGLRRAACVIEIELEHGIVKSLISSGERVFNDDQIRLKAEFLEKLSHTNTSMPILSGATVRNGSSDKRSSRITANTNAVPNELKKGSK